MWLLTVIFSALLFHIGHMGQLKVRQASSSHNQSSLGSLWKKRETRPPTWFYWYGWFCRNVSRRWRLFCDFLVDDGVYCLHAKDTKKVLSLQIWVTVYKMQIEERVPFSKNTNQAKYSKKMQQNREERCSPGTLPFECFSLITTKAIIELKTDQKRQNIYLLETQI